MPIFAELAEIPEWQLLEFVEKQLKIYGHETNLERSVPDYRDGLKPVARRVLWAMNQLPKDQNIKSARIVGDTMGRYHPHADVGIYGALATMVNHSVPPVTGIGGWGTLIDSPAAMRYTNAKLSQFGKLFFGRHYIPITQCVPSFDGKDKEPVVLPALLPNLLFNGTQGIGVGMRTTIPGFTPSSVLRMLVRILEREKLTPLDFAKGLDFYSQYGGKVPKTKVNLKNIEALMGSTKGSVLWTVPLEVIREKKQIRIKEYGPKLNPIKLVEETLKPMSEVAQVYNESGLNYVIQARKDLNFNEFDKLVLKVQKAVDSRVSYEIYVTERNPDERDPDKYTTEFLTTSIPDLMMRWLKWRVNLEAQSLDYRISLVEKEIAYIKLMIFACSKLDIIFQCLKRKTDDHAEWLAKALKITLEQANMILDLKVRQLSKLDEEALKERLKDANERLKDLQRRRKKPSLEVKAFLNLCLDKFQAFSREAGTFQFQLTKAA